MDKMIEENEKAMCILKNEGEKTLKDLAKMLGITTEGARFQLLKLSNEGYVKSESRAMGRGRPQQFWSLTKKGHDKFPNRHSELTLRLINKIKKEYGEDALSQIIASTAEDNLNHYRKTIEETDTLEEKVRKLAELREREGYMASFKKTDDGDFMLIENHCPICDAASLCQNFCSSELDIFQVVLGPGAQIKRTKHILTGDRRCAYLIQESDNLKG